MAASESEIAEVRAAVLLKRCWRYFVPPSKMERPRTSRTFPIIDPVMDAFTTPVRPFDNAIMAIINSAALPKVAFNNPPTPAPTRAASDSVARPIQGNDAKARADEDGRRINGAGPESKRNRDRDKNHEPIERRLETHNIGMILEILFLASCSDCDITIRILLMCDVL